MSSLANENAVAGPSSAGQATSMKRKSAAGKACLNCRRRKSRCNGLPPTCQTCEAYNDECIWGTDDDARKPASRQYVNALQQRIKVLEAALRERRQSIPSPIGIGDEEDDQGGADQESYEGLTATMLHLHMSDAGEDVHYHGPTSAYAHATHVPVLSTSPAASKINETSDRPHDYRLFLPRTVQLSHAQHSIILDRFFRFFSSWGLRVSPQLFMQDMIRAVMLPPNTPPARFSHYSPFLHNIILAIALMWADEEHLCNADTRSLFAEHAEKFLSVELARPTLATVQGLALKSSLHSTLGDHTSGWAYFGMAERVCLSLGLNVNCADLVTTGKMSAAEMQYRQHTFWTVFIQEQCWAVYIGRPHVAQDYTIPLPPPDPALDELPWTWHSLDVPDRKLPPQPSMYATTFAETAKLTLIMQRVMSTFYSPKSDGRTHNEQKVSELSIALDSWSEALPSSLVITGHSQKNALPHIIVLQLAKEWLTILIYRPYYRALAGHRNDPSGSVLDTAVTRCDRSADRINTLLRVYHTRFGLRYTPPTLFNIAFMAGSTHLLAAVWHRTASVKASALQQASECVTFLRHVAESWPAAGHKADILQTLVRDYAEPAKSATGTLQSTAKVRSPASEHPTTTAAKPLTVHPQQPLPIPSSPMAVPTPGSLDWFASLVQNQGASTNWGPTLSSPGVPESHGANTFAQSNPIDTSSNYLQSLMAMLSANNTSPSTSFGASPTVLDPSQSWRVATNLINPSIQPFQQNNPSAQPSWSDVTISGLGNPSPQDTNLPWTFDFS